MEDVAQAYDQPFGNSSALAAHYCARLAASDGVEKLLGGDGGDEIFGGNARYAKQNAFDVYRHVPAGMDRTLVDRALVRPALVTRLPLVRKLRSYVVQARTPMPARLHTYNLVSHLGVDALFSPAFLSAIDASRPYASEAAWYARCADENLINRILHYDWKYTLADNDLPKVLTTADLAGVPIGFPMLDESLVEFANRLPAAWKVRGLQLRPFFKRALADFLPREILRKKKHGFGLPFGFWLVENKSLQALARDTLASLRRRGVMNGQFVDDLIDRRVAHHAGYYGELVWVSMMLEMWLSNHAPGFSLH
jgi:asparagine synthase (glutamine-hydrolysing)